MKIRFLISMLIISCLAACEPKVHYDLKEDDHKQKVRLTISDKTKNIRLGVSNIPDFDVVTVYADSAMGMRHFGHDPDSDVLELNNDKFKPIEKEHFFARGNTYLVVLGESEKPPDTSIEVNSIVNFFFQLKIE